MKVCDGVAEEVVGGVVFDELPFTEEEGAVWSAVFLFVSH